MLPIHDLKDLRDNGPFPIECAATTLQYALLSSSREEIRGYIGSRYPTTESFFIFSALGGSGVGFQKRALLFQLLDHHVHRTCRPENSPWD